MNGAPPGSIYACHKSGWMQLEIFVEWFKHFSKLTGSIKENPVLLILDGHSTHTMNMEVIDLARANGVVLLCLPPHCSHKMRPLDVSFMKLLSIYYDQELEKWLCNHPGRVVTTFQVAELFEIARDSNYGIHNLFLRLPIVGQKFQITVLPPNSRENFVASRKALIYVLRDQS